VLRPNSQPQGPRELAGLTVEAKRTARERAKFIVHVMVVNFTHETIELPRATVLGL
jgi:hypothetical protein